MYRLLKNTFPAIKTNYRDIISIIGYNDNLRFQAITYRKYDKNIILGLESDSPYWKKAINDNWVPGKNLFEIDEAVDISSMMIVSYPRNTEKIIIDEYVKYFDTGDTLCLTDSYSLLQREHFDLLIPSSIDIMLLTPIELREKTDIIVAKYQDYSGLLDGKIDMLAQYIDADRIQYTTFMNHYMMLHTSIYNKQILQQPQKSINDIDVSTFILTEYYAFIKYAYYNNISIDSYLFNIKNNLF
jgi:hypothetical protein